MCRSFGQQACRRLGISANPRANFGYYRCWRTLLKDRSAVFKDLPKRTIARLMLLRRFVLSTNSPSHQQRLLAQAIARLADSDHYSCVQLVVGWSTSTVQNRQLVLQAVLMAVWQREDRSPLISHSNSEHIYEPVISGDLTRIAIDLIWSGRADKHEANTHGHAAQSLSQEGVPEKYSTR